MNLLQLRTLVYSLVDDPQGGYFTPAQVNVYLNNAVKEVQKKLLKAGQNYYVKRVTTPLIVNQRDYILPEDFKKLHRLEIIVSGSAPNETTSVLAPITINQQDLVANQTGQPYVYTIQRNRLILRPAPSTPYKLRLYYSYLAVDMQLDTDIPDVPESYQQLVALYAARDCYLKDGRVADLILSKINSYEKDLDLDATERNEDISRQIVVTGDDSYGGFYF